MTEIMWFVRIPTYMGIWDTRLAEIVPVPAHSCKMQEWSEGWTTNDLGERVPLPFQTFAFNTHEEALEFIEGLEQ